MIPTPLYSENPKGFLRAENFDAEDGIPLEKGSGFGNNLTRDVLTSSIVIHYIEVTATTTVDVSARYSDLHLRIVGAGEGIIVTVAGQLPQGRRLHVDVQAAENASSLIIGGVTYELPAGGGVLTFVSTSDGWSAPLKMEFDLRVVNSLRVDGDIYPRVREANKFYYDKVQVGPSVGPGDTQVIPEGLHIVYMPSAYGSPRISVPVKSVDLNTRVLLGQAGQVCFVPSDGVNYWMENRHTSENAYFYLIKV